MFFFQKVKAKTAIQKKKHEVFHRGCVHKLKVKKCLITDMGDVQVVCRGVKSEGKLIVRGR